MTWPQAAAQMDQHQTGSQYPTHVPEAGMSIHKRSEGSTLPEGWRAISRLSVELTARAVRQTSGSVMNTMNTPNMEL